MKTNAIIKAIFFLIISTWITNLYSQEQKIRPGNVLEIVVYEHQELSRTVTVSPEGTINFPFLQNIPVDGLTADELQKIITVQVGKFINLNPIVTVTIVDTYVISVTVLGQVERPGYCQVPVKSTIQGAIAQAGKVLPGANLRAVKILRENSDGKTSTITVDLIQFLTQGNPKLLPPLEAGDIIVVPSHSISAMVKVMGEVNRPGSFELLPGNNNLLDVLFLAGGPTRDANLDHVILVSPITQQRQEMKISLKESFYSKKYKPLPELYPGDIIFIPTKINIWGKILSVARDVTTFATLYIIFRYGRRF
jgi:polysaccharide biosynthesis/export protein